MQQIDCAVQWHKTNVIGTLVIHALTTANITSKIL